MLKKLFVGAGLISSAVAVVVQGILITVWAHKGLPYEHAFLRLGVEGALAVWFLYQWKMLQRVKEPVVAESRPFASLVLLLRSPRLLTEEGLRRAVGQSLGVVVEGNPEVVTGRNPLFLVRVREHLLLVNNYDQPYFEDALAAAQQIPEAGLRQAVEEHHAWMSIDLVRKPDDEPLEDAYRLIGPLLAALSGADCLALHNADTGDWKVWDNALMEPLQSHNPLSALAMVTLPGQNSEVDSSKRVRAANVARERWIEFAASFAERSAKELHFVKARIVEEEKQEFCWVRVDHVADGEASGQLDTSPLRLELKRGERVTVPLEEVWDWVVTPDEGDAMGFFSRSAGASVVPVAKADLNPGAGQSFLKHG